MPGKKLLVADDSLTIQKVIRLALSNEGYDIQAISDGKDALQKISLFQPDAILIDVSLPGKSAFEVKREINSHADLDRVRFILMSSAFETVDEAQANEVVFHGRLVKPFDPANLRQVLLEVLSSDTTPPPLPKMTPAEDSNWDMPQDLTRNTSYESQEATTDLWDSPPPFTGPPHPPAPPKMPSPNHTEVEEFEPDLTSQSNSRSDDDIKKLTDSTLKISGMDDFQWSVNEPSLRPLPNISETRNQPPAFPGNLPPPPLPPIPGFPEIPQNESEDHSEESPASYSSPFHDMPAPPDFELQTEPEAPLPAVGSPYPPYSKGELESLIQIQVQEMLQKMTQTLLPDIAEKLIKQEIHKMLSGEGG